MPKELIIVRPTVDVVLDQVVNAASTAQGQGLVRQLTCIDDGLKQRLLSGNRDTARLAASEFMSTYFGTKVR